MSVPLAPSARPPLELWGGLECTVNRVDDRVLDQVELSGHAARADDLDRFAALGLRALRYPLLWERTAPEGVARADWRWADERLGRLRALGVRPIVGLVHHGSGPRSTSLVDSSFVEGLAAYAGAVAARYPWVTDWTPVNEPLTTARFAGLYGHWYPHGRDEATWARALLIQCRATLAAMRAIRRVNPAARLVQTEDLGKTWATPALGYQAEFENERRWLSFDLLCGRVAPGHWMWQYLRWLGVPERELTPFLEAPCPPDVVGVNHYLTSERFLDERTERYPATSRGGNGRHAYADVEAVRVLAAGLDGPEGVLRSAWERYRLPVAVTEAHLGCTREEQLRWLVEVWEGAARLRDEGADVRAVTAWSLLGAFDWDSLLTQPRGRYEPGVFDLRAPAPRPTALAGLLRQLAAGRQPGHPVLAEEGWWRRPTRLVHPPVPAAEVVPPRRGAPSRPRRGAIPPLLIAGEGALAAAFARACDVRGLAWRRLGDLLPPPADVRAWAVVDAREDGLAESETARRSVPVEARVGLAEACAERAIPLVAFSPEIVFDGKTDHSYVESDPLSALGAEGAAAAAAERGILAAHAGVLMVRAGPRFGGGADPVARLTAALLDGAAAAVAVPVAAATVSPASIPDLVDTALDLLIDGERGVWHLATGAATWEEIAREIAALAGIETAIVIGERPDPAAGNWVLGSDRGWPLPSLPAALAGAVRPWLAAHKPAAPAREPLGTEPVAFPPRQRGRRARRAS